MAEKRVFCNINFNRQAGIYCAGQMVSGDINIRVNKKFTVKSLLLFVRGIGYCSWGSGKSSVRGHAAILNSQIDLVQSQTDFALGNHKYKFNFVLPQDLPSTTQGEVNSKQYQISYEIALYFLIPRKFDFKFTQGFTVVSGINLNRHPEFKVPVSEENEDMIALIPRTGFVPGEEIPVNVQIKNPNDDRIQKIVCSLHKDVSHKIPACSFCVSSNYYIEKVYRKEENFNADQASYDFILKVPVDNGALTLDNPNYILINIQYKIRIKIELKKSIFTSTSNLQIPVKICMIPF